MSVLSPVHRRTLFSALSRFQYKKLIQKWNRSHIHPLCKGPALGGARMRCWLAISLHQTPRLGQFLSTPLAPSRRLHNLCKVLSWLQYAAAVVHFFRAIFLPFIALTAQFPYQAVTTWDNLMSAILILGSPALAAYSLIMTFLGTRWFRKQCASALDLMPVSTQEELWCQERLESILIAMKGVICLAQ